MSLRDLRRRVLAAGLLTAWLFSPGTVLAHADIVERISALDREIGEGPQTAALYLKRGELHRLHRDWPAALTDYERAVQIEPGNPAVDYYRGRMWLEAGHPVRAQRALDRFLTVQPDHANALLIRSRALALVGERLAAADDLTRAIALLDVPTPEVYLERARVLVAEGAAYIDQALAGLDAGIAQLGPLVTLIEFAIEVERAQGRYLPALIRLESLPERIGNQPSWLELRGDLLMAAGQTRAARAAYITGLEAIDSYPSARRSSRATLELETRLRTSLEKTGAKL